MDLLKPVVPKLHQEHAFRCTTDKAGRTTNLMQRLKFRRRAVQEGPFLRNLIQQRKGRVNESAPKSDAAQEVESQQGLEKPRA